jgi:hypothetical protein
MPRLPKNAGKSFKEERVLGITCDAGVIVLSR